MSAKHGIVAAGERSEVEPPPGSEAAARKRNGPPASGREAPAARDFAGVCGFGAADFRTVDAMVNRFHRPQIGEESLIFAEGPRGAPRGESLRTAFRRRTPCLGSADASCLRAWQDNPRVPAWFAS